MIHIYIYTYIYVYINVNQVYRRDALLTLLELVVQPPGFQAGRPPRSPRGTSRLKHRGTV